MTQTWDSHILPQPKSKKNSLLKWDNFSKNTVSSNKEEEPGKMDEATEKKIEKVPEAFPYHNLEHATNSCYIIIVACFASSEAWDVLLSPPGSSTKAAYERMRGTLRSIVNQIRQGKAVSSKTVEKFCRTMIYLGFPPPGEKQEDAVELFTKLMEYLDEHHQKLHETLVYDATGEGIIKRLTFEQTSGEVTLSSLLDKRFKGEQCLKAPMKPVVIPFALTRNTATGEKNDKIVKLPTSLGFTKFVSDGDGRQYSIRLKSVVCHKGKSINSGHYIAYTYDPTSGWRRWDMKNGQMEHDEQAGDSWLKEITRDSYMVLYELSQSENQEDKENLDDEKLTLLDNLGNDFKRRMLLFGIDQIEKMTDADARHHEFIDLKNSIQTMKKKKAISGLSSELVHALQVLQSNPDVLQIFNSIINNE